VQSIHAAQNATTNIPDNLHIIVCSAKTELHLMILVSSLNLIPFYEPDFDGAMTAAASKVLTNRRPYRKLKLLGVTNGV
jgi:hypothetical protein